MRSQPIVLLDASAYVPVRLRVHTTDPISYPVSLSSVEKNKPPNNQQIEVMAVIAHGTTTRRRDIGTL